MYHRVVPIAQAGATLEALDVPPARFAAQMAALASAGWRTITAAQLADDLAAAVTPPPKTFVVTFDDGYDDGYTYALPILQAHGFVGTYFIVPGRVTEANWAGIALSPEHIRALAAAGMEIANHTYSHIGLAGKPIATVRHQVVAASERIERIVGTAPTTFAYPFGAWDAPSADEVAAAGMVLAFTTVEGAREAWATRLESPRIRVGPSTTPAALVAQLAPYQ
jgi:peptidoglycan/xylan/chitin deacetylase (PgdA/CDA1 family)